MKPPSFIAALSIWTSGVAFVALSAEPPPRAQGQESVLSAAKPAAPMFVPGAECQACHNNLTSAAGEDVSIGVSWRGTMMANSGRDPYFHASVRRETADHPIRATEIEDECAACHMPAARQTARAAGHPGQVFAHLPVGTTRDSSEDRLAADGVTCTVCHQIAPDGLGTRERVNGNFSLAPPLASGHRRIFGPFAVDAGRKRIMHSVTGFEQVEAPHIRQSELCASCHTLITEAYGPDGRVIGFLLPEQMNYQEWRHSAFDEEERSCQSCHMPPVTGPVQVSSVLGEPRETLARHAFVGGNAFMLRLLNRYRAELGVEATPGELEATARATVRQLERDTAVISIDRAERAGTTFALDVSVTNLTGHKFPTGYPSRRTWLHVTVRDGSGRTLFESGRVNESGAIEGNDGDANAAAFEPHYAEITRADQVQIYESIMGTPAGVPTTGLLQATQYLKDNRLLPRGFDKTTAADEIAVRGGARDDSDFGGAKDTVRYRMPIDGTNGVRVEVELRYQPIAYRWAQNLGSYKSVEPGSFVHYYDSMSSSSSVVIATATHVVP